jgi:hypothetical protein
MQIGWLTDVDEYDRAILEHIADQLERLAGRTGA